MPTEWMLPTIIFLPFAAAMLALLIGRFTGRHTGFLMVLSAVAAFGLSLSQFISLDHGNPTTFDYWWIQDLNIRLSFKGDQFGLFFAMIISGIGTLVGIYSLNYLPDLAKARIGRFYAALTAFMGAMLGVALSDDLILLFVFWEITSISSFMLIGFWSEKDFARHGAMTALQVTGLGGLAMMAGFVMVGVITGTFSITELSTQTALQAKLTSSPLFVAALLLILVGAFTKSAQWPFHFWLPGAMVAPTPVSTYLHAATMVKAGIFLVGRMLPIFGDSTYWSPILITFGLITFALGAYQALLANDLKAILARTTISTLGLVMMIYGLKAAEQDALQILNHAAYKGSLFLVAGIIEHATQTRDLRELGGLRRKMPITFCLCLLAAWSMAGLPPLLGFLAKESLYAQLLHNKVLLGWPVAQWLIIGACVVTNAFIFAVGVTLVRGLFFGKETQKASHAHEAGFSLWLPPAVLVAVMVVLGLAGLTHFSQKLVNSLSSDSHAHAHVALIPSQWGPFLLSMATISLGILVYCGRAVVQRIHENLDLLPTMQTIWDRFIASITWFAVNYSKRWQNGSLWWYLCGILAFFVGITIYAYYATGLRYENLDLNITTISWYALALIILLGIAVGTVAMATTRLAAAVAITVVGFLVSLVFVIYRSPDILLTQILIETVSTIFILLILFFMPPFTKELVAPGRKAFNIAISSGVGLVMFTLVLLSISDTFRQSDNLASDYLSRAQPDAGGHNAVNVIIVDFRAIDTTGEIAVLVVVGLCIFGLLRGRRAQA